MRDRSPLNTLGPNVVEEVFRKSVGDPDARLLNWDHESIHVGSVGELYRLSGKVQSNTAIATPCSLVLKIQRRWERGNDPECWKREALVYRSHLFEELPAAFGVPQCYSIQERQDETWYWFEEVTGATAGQFQGRYIGGRPLPTYPWLSSRRWTTHTVSNWGTGAIPWLNSSDSSSLTNSIREQTLALWAERDAFIDVVDGLPRTVCHRDFNPENLFLSETRSGAHTTVIDWDCVGIGALAEDIGDLVGEALVFQEWDMSRALDLKEHALAAYHEGLVKSGGKLSLETVELGFATLSPLQWCFRLICRYKDAEDLATRELYAAILQFMLELGRDARRLAW